ncbi:A-kinase anchor protein 9 isoform X2 [Brienomyrus brachyistius]|uniref:A-kinase anchor protein 9 isoform X2 n=1 Tax=Brienomyrus brachyistius TaxID=42636 RepID=UPI0020B28C0A|nr:A-kinase anchor protein 9 isoform X2 [Brienomyrus brachyistius]
MEDEERQKKLEAGKAKLAEYRQRKAQADGQNRPRRKKKGSRAKEADPAGDEGDPDPPRSGQGGTPAPPTEFTISRTLRSGETVKHGQTYTIEPESEVSTTAEDCSSEVNGCHAVTESAKGSREDVAWEEDLLLSGLHSEHEGLDSQTRLQMVEDELAVKSQEVEELRRELQDIRATFGTEGVQQLQDFEAAIKDRDGIITQLTANLQQARKEKDEIMREFLEMTEQSQRLQIQFQQLQAGETLRNTSHSSTTADLLHAKQQIVTYQQQIHERDAELQGQRERSQQQLLRINRLQDQLAQNETLVRTLEESYAQKLDEKDLLITKQRELISEQESSLTRLKEELTASQKMSGELNTQVAARNQELESYRSELAGSKQRERRSSEEIHQLMATVEDLQKRCHRESQSESDILQRVEGDLEKKMEQLRAELDEMYGQQIVQMKQELRLQHSQEMEKLKERHRVELERVGARPAVNPEQVSTLNKTIGEMQQMLRESQMQEEEANRELSRVSEEKLSLQSQVDDLLKDLRAAKGRVERASQSISFQEKKLSEAEKLHGVIGDLQAQLAAMAEATKELEAKHESEVTNYKIKLEMMEREKDAVLDMMAESQEAELERLRTHLLFSHEEELVKLREDLQRENLLNIENLKDELASKHKQGLEKVQRSLEEQLRIARSEKDGVQSERDALVLDITALRNQLNESLENDKSEELTLRLGELEAEIVELRKEGEEKGTLEREIQELLCQNDHLEKQGKEREASSQQIHKELESENMALKEANRAVTQESLNTREENEHLTTAVDQLNKRISDLEREAEAQRNTFSFAEKNFEVNYQELKDEYACLASSKVELEEKLQKKILGYEARLRDLHSQICEQRGHKDRAGEQQGGTGKSHEMDEDFYDAVEVLEKDAFELMEKLEVAEREKGGLLLQLTGVSQQLASKESRVEELEVKLEAVREENRRIVERREQECLQQRGGESLSGYPSGHAVFHEEKAVTLQSSLQPVEKQSAGEQRVALEPGAPRGAPVERSPATPALPSDGESPRQRGAAEDSLHVELQEKERALAAAEQEIRDLKETLRMLRAWRTEDGQEVGELGSGVVSEDEFRLQMEAQRISLSQIHAAQLELQQESLQAEREASLRGLELELRASHWRELERLREALDLKGDGSDPSEWSEACLGQVERLKAEFQEQQTQLEEQHGLEIERLRSHYQQQAKEAEERYGAEILLLQHRVQELAGDEALSRLSAETPSSGLEMMEESEEIKLEDVEMETELTQLLKPMGLSTQLQALRKALHDKYLQEVAALREEHRTELEQLAPPPAAQGPGVDGSDPASLMESLEKQQQEKVEVEIAKVIVQMSVEFAQQTERARLAKRARETSSGIQTQSEELGWQDAGELEEVDAAACPLGCPGELQEAGGSLPMEKAAQQVTLKALQQELGQQELEHRQALEVLRVTHAEQLELQRDQQLQLSAELQQLRAQLAQRDAELKDLSPDDGVMAADESREPPKSVPTTQSSGTQTEPTSEETEESGRETPRAGGAKPTAPFPASDEPEPPPTDVITTERNLLRKANATLWQVLSDVLKTTRAAEETIGRHVEGLLETSSRGQPRHRSAWQRAAVEPSKPRGDALAADPGGDASSDTFCGSKSGVGDAWSLVTESDEGLEMPQQLVEELLFRPELQLENEEDLMNVSSRLQAAVEKLLVAINKTTDQLEHARVAQTELMRESFRRNEEMHDLLRRQEELQEQLVEEAKVREQLAMELHRAEGLIDGYTDERATLETRLREKEELQLHLEQELRVTGSRLRELEQEREQMEQERELLARQQGAMRGAAGPRELCLLEETEKLMKEKVEVQLQAEKDNSDLQKQVKCLEMELEEQVNKAIELEEAHRSESSDLRQQIQALEKQLENNRKFLDEQAVDREHERDVFQQEITKLEVQLKNSMKQQSSNEERTREVDQLTIQLKEKSDWCSELLLGSEQLQRDIQERNEEIEKLEGRVRELEQALLTSAESPRKGEDQRQTVLMQKTDDSSLEALLQTEREALDRKEKEISNLEEQLEQFREELENKSEEVQQLQMQLEIQRKELNTQQEDLEHKSGLLKVLEEKDRQIALLNQQLSMLQKMETAPDNKMIEEKNELLRELETQVECLKSEQERLRRNNELEVDQLNDVIEKLQQELSKIEHKSSEEYLPDAEDLSGASREEVSLSKEEFDEMKQKIDETTQELNTLKANHNSLLEKCRGLEEEKLDVLSAKENERSHVEELEEALQEKTAAAVVMQAQIQALEQSASSKVADLTKRVEELEACVEEKDSELTDCRLRVEQAQAEAVALQLKISILEDKLRDKMASLLVSQAQLSAVQLQSEEAQTKELCGQTSEAESLLEFCPCEAREEAFEGPSSIPETPEEVREARRTPVAKVVHLVEKLKDLEDGLREILKDQELQKHLLSSSEEEVVEYEKRLAVIMSLLNRMTAKSIHRKSPPLSTESSSLKEEDPATDSGLLLEMREVRQEAAAVREELRTYREQSERLEKELQVKELTISQLQEDLQKTCDSVSKETELLQELHEVRREAAVTKEELSAYRERSEQLQKEMEEREMAIADLKEDLQRVSDIERKEASAAESELLKELQEVREEAAATKEELNSYRERSDKLKEELQLRDASLAKLQQELQQVGAALARTQEDPSSQKEEKGGKLKAVEETQASSPEELPSPVRKNSMCQTDRPSISSGGSQTERLVFMDAGAQADLAVPGPDASEEIAEVIGEYDERIGQMQELHAAEIMDMEARHISESEALKGEAQLLQQECQTLKIVIEKLRTAESVSSRPEQPVLSRSRDEYTSESGSDWSQHTCDVSSLNQEFRSTPEGGRRDNETGQGSIDVLPDRIKSLLREVHQEGMQVLSLSELPLLEGEQPATPPRPQGWLREREALLASIDSLKALISRMQTSREEQPGEGATDWRSELLRAVQQVLVSERGVLKSALYARLEQLDTSDMVVHLNQLERRLSEQEAQHREALEILGGAERRSLLMEVQHLRAQMQMVQQEPGQMKISVLRPAQSPSPGERDRQEGQGTPSSAGASQDLRGLPAERMVLDELKGELAQTKLELETTLKAQHKYLKALESLRSEVAEKVAEVDRLTEALASEQRRSRELQWAFEKEKCKRDKYEKEEQEELEDLRLALEEQQSRAVQLSESLDQQQGLTAQLQREVETGRAQLSRVQSRASELRVQLESARARALELAGALERERETRQQHGAGDPEAEEGAQSTGALLEALRAQLDEKHGRLVRLVEEVERYKLEASQAELQREEDERANRINTQQEQEAQLKVLQAKVKELQRLVLQLQQEKNRLENKVEELQASARSAEAGDPTGTLQEDPWKGESQPSDRTRDWVLRQKVSDVLTADSGTGSPEAPAGGATPAESQHVAAIVNRLQLIATKIRSMVNRMPVDEVDSKALAWLQGSVQNVISLVQQLPAIPPVPESVMASGPSSSLTERLLRQNAELTGFVSRLTEEKNDLRNSLLRLEEEQREHRQRCLGTGEQTSRRAVDDQAALSALLSSEREAWARERSRLQKSLRQAEAEVSRLKAEIRTDSLRDVAGPEADTAALKRIYGKYLRAESFRKALIYQKKYLLLLLGGFQECEEATLSLIARMGGRPPHSGLEAISQRRRGFTRFRSAVRVSIALTRMRFLVRRWQRATGSGSSSSSSVNRNGLAQIAGNEVRIDSPFLHAGGLEVCGERRGTSRGRTGPESPRFHTVTDAGTLACSHLQNYDPDRALTDYISRLEALQRRLGSVQSGSSYAQLHFGIRR